MAGSAGVTEGTQIKLYYNVAALTDHTSASVDTFVGVSTNEVLCVTDIGAAEATFNVIEYNKFGSINSSKTAGGYSAGDFTFDVAYDDSDANHMSFSTYGIPAGSMKPSVKGSYVIEIRTGTDAATYVVMDGIITGSSMALSVDGLSTLTTTVSLEERPDFVQAA